MNLLIISTDFPPLLGGIATYTQSLATEMARQGHRVEVLAPRFAGWRQLDAGLEPGGIRILRAAWTPLLREIHLWMLGRRRLNRLGAPAAILATAWFPAGFIAYSLHRWTGVDYYLSAHGSEFLDDRFTLRRRIKSALRFLKRPIFSSARAIFPVSRFSAGLLRRQGVAAEQIRVVHNGADPGRFRPNRDASRLKQKHAVEGRLVLLSVCRLDAHKGVHLMLEALPELCRRFPSLLYAVIGRGPEEMRLHQLAASLELPEAVKWLGFVPQGEILEWYQLCDLYVTLSHQIPGRSDLIEGFGICFVEAAACAKATLGCRFAGVPDAVEDGKTGLLISSPPGRDEIVEAASSLLSDQQLRDRLGAAGRRRVEEELNWEQSARKILRSIELPKNGT